MTVYEVRLPLSVQEKITEEIFETAVNNPEGFVETGGWCWSPQGQAWWGDGLDIIEASGPGIGAERTYDTLFLPSDHLLDLDEMFRRDGLELCGGWHLHPSGDQFPSELDLTRVGRVLDLRAIWESRTQRAIELIITREPKGEWTWCVTPWIFYRGPSGILGTPGVHPEAAVLRLEEK